MIRVVAAGQSSTVPPEALGREPRTLGERSQLRPAELGMDARSHAAVGPCDHVLAPEPVRETDDPLGDVVSMT